MWPNAILRIWEQLKTSQGGVIGLVGLQGVGKSSAILAFFALVHLLDRDAKSNDIITIRPEDVVHLKWRKQQDLFSSLLNGTHELSKTFRCEYASELLEQLKSRSGLPLILLSELEKIKNPETLNIDWAEKYLGKKVTNKLREIAWFEMLGKKKLILIDTQDYSLTDHRSLTRDLEEIYWLWNNKLIHTKTNVVIAIQKEMFCGHFFLDKMQKIELTPLTPRKMLEAYVKRFGNTYPFTEDALLCLARMSRGIFRRYLRYITLTLDLWERMHSTDLISVELVKKAVTIDQLAEDMEVELSDLFPKHSDLRFKAVELLMHLQEHGPEKQSNLTKALEVEDYVMSRLLTKLEHAKYIVRARDGTDKIVSVTNQDSSFSDVKISC